MCVIIVASDKRPTADMVAKAYTHNDDGAGIAYREPAPDGHGNIVVWKKGMELDEAQAVIAKAPFPFIAHFRIASSGGVMPELCHPFEISREVSFETEGRTKNYVLFHNGDWKAWRHTALDTAIRKGEYLPVGRWSDTRSMAWLGSIYGPGFYELIDEKIVIFGPEDMDFFGGPWKMVDGLLCSNDYFTHTAVPLASPATAIGTSSQAVQTIRVCRRGNCRENALNGTDYCLDHSNDGWVPEIEQPGRSSPERSPFEKLLTEGCKKNPTLALRIAQKAVETKNPDGSRKLSKQGYKRIHQLAWKLLNGNMPLDLPAAQIH